MSDDIKPIEEILSVFENSTEKFMEYDVARAIESEIGNVSDPQSVPNEYTWEKMAFEFCEDYPDVDTGWGTYYGPMMSGPTGDGQYFEYPSIRKLTPDTVAYWVNRASEARHPVLAVRYADLTWEFSKAITNSSADYTVAQIAIDGRIEIAQQDLQEPTLTIQHLRRALSLAISLNDSSRIEKVGNAILAYEDHVAEDEKAGLWGFGFDLLVSNRKFALPKDLEEKIIQDLEDRLDRLTQLTDEMFLTSHRWKAQAALSRLTSYYHKQGQAEEVKRVILKYYEGFRHLVGSEASFIASGWLQEVYSTFKQYGFNEEAEAIAPNLREVWGRASNEMATHSFEMEVTKEELDQYVDSLLADSRESATIRMTVHFIPKRDEAENQVRQLAQDYPMSFLITKQLLDHEGRPVASVGSIEDDFDGNVVHQVSQNMAYATFFLRNVLDAYVDRFEVSTQELLSHIYTSPIFADDKKGIVEKGIDAFMQGDALTSVHLLIPQIEAAIRRLAELLGIAIIRPGRSGAMQYRLLDELLRDPNIEETLGRDASWYFRILLTDQRGWNLRNSVSHGLLPHEQFEQGMADRVLHALLLLCLIRENLAEASA
ncbi:MAG: DUF4209 domain-containing protein [Chloroflexi bacterium]|nr:DUF4209 domain-containing protein [Chloroflexota bacterium]